MKTLDRYIFRGLMVNYLIAIGVMVSLYVVFDLFFNIDEFTETGKFTEMLGAIASFYGNRIFLYFSQLSGVITLFACLFTLARMRRSNELTAMLASGVSLYRVAAPVLGFALLTTGLWYANTELVVPNVAHKLARRHDDARGLKSHGVWFMEDRNGALVSAVEYRPQERILRNLLVTEFSEEGVLVGLIKADRGEWELTPEGPAKGQWNLQRGVELASTIENAEAGLAPSGDMAGKMVSVYTSDLDPETIQMRQANRWMRFLSTTQLAELESRLEGEARDEVRTMRHERFTNPMVSVLMLVVGLPFILHRVPGNIIADAGKCIFWCGGLFLLNFLSQNITVSAQYSALPAWLPILIGLPVAVVLMDRMRT